jgi:adenine deaminase
MNQSGHLDGTIIDAVHRTIFTGRITWTEGRITSITPQSGPDPGRYILPGFIDAHVHIESSMLTPYEFARQALIHGTVATVSDPHEIANVCGLDGVHYMLENARDARLKFNFGAPSCVPATGFETAGAILGVADIETLLQRSDIRYLSEMMNYPGVLFHDPVVMEKLALARKYGKPVDGHSPGLTGDAAIAYINAGISTDHECFTYDEALHKIQHGMKILIREGSAARNFEVLHPLISQYPDRVMLCSDDKHPDELLHGHINSMVKRALILGHDLFDVLQCACLNPVTHYQLPVGLLRVNDPADFIVIDNLQDMNILETYVDGEKMASNGTCSLPLKNHPVINNFSTSPKSPDDFLLPGNGTTVRVIEAIDGQIVTGQSIAETRNIGGYLEADPSQDILKITLVNRYDNTKPAVAFIKNFKLQQGAIASTVAHDSHNIIAVGTDNESLATAVNALIDHQGGLCVTTANLTKVLPLPVAGLMSTGSCDEIGHQYAAIEAEVKAMGCDLRAPFMTLSFMALLVIPRLKISDHGLFDGTAFAFTSVQPDSEPAPA